MYECKAPRRLRLSFLSQGSSCHLIKPCNRILAHLEYMWSSYSGQQVPANFGCILTSWPHFLRPSPFLPLPYHAGFPALLHTLEPPPTSGLCTSTSPPLRGPQGPCPLEPHPHLSLPYSLASFLHDICALSHLVYWFSSISTTDCKLPESRDLAACSPLEPQSPANSRCQIPVWWARDGMGAGPGWRCPLEAGTGPLPGTQRPLGRGLWCLHGNSLT